MVLRLASVVWVDVCVIVIAAGRRRFTNPPQKNSIQQLPPKKTASDTGLAEHPELVQALVGELMPEARRLYEGALAAALSSMTSQQGYVKGSVCGI